MSLPGDGDPPRVSADLSLDWQTWSQSAWRSMSMGEHVDEPPEIGIEVVFRVQRLASRPALATVLSVLPEDSPDIGGDNLARSAPVIEEAYRRGSAATGSGRRGGVRGQLPVAGAERRGARPKRRACSRAGPVLASSAGDALRSRWAPHAR